MQFWVQPDLTDEFGNVLNFVRESERAADEMRDPKDRKSAERFRIIWLEEKVQVVYETMVRMGKLCFGEEFHMSWPYFLNLRPFYVKDATRVTCMCVYHLRWREFFEGLLKYRNAMRQQKISKCSCEWPKTEKLLRKQLICPPMQTRGELCLDNLDCISQRCNECKDLRKLTSGVGSLCEDEMRDPTQGLALSVHYESYEKILYRTKDGTEKERKDFVSKEVPFSEFKSSFAEYWPKFIAHNDAKWHDNDFAALKSKLPRHMAGLVIDYAENYSHQPRFEHQSKYFCQVQSTVIPVVLMLHVEDLTNINVDERIELIRLFDELQLPHVIAETHLVVSSDMQHDNAMVQKVMDDFIMPYLHTNAPSVTMVHARSDGCKAQFKCAANFYWVSRQLKEGSGLVVNWSFFESCHGKCYCDPEGGAFKNSARHHELCISDPSEQLRDSENLFDWAQNRSELHRPKLSLQQKKGKGIFRRFFYWVPSKGVGAVNRSRLPKLTAQGTSRLHEFVDIGVVGTVSTRRASCHQCDSCWSGARHNCKNLDYTGHPMELKIVTETVPSAATTRIDRVTMSRDAVTRATNAAKGSTVCFETHKDEQSLPWVLGLIVTAVCNAPSGCSVPYDSSKDPVHFEPIRVNEPAIQVTLYNEPLQPGSSTYTLSELTMWVPARCVKVIDVELLEARESRLSAARKRFKIEESSLLRIHAAMPNTDDSWIVEKVLQYRCLYGVEQWLVKWQGYEMEHNTWEPWENLGAHVQLEAQQTRSAGLPRDEAGLLKVVVVTLKAVLQERGLDASGTKAQLVARLLDALRVE